MLCIDSQKRDKDLKRSDNKLKFCILFFDASAIDQTHHVTLMHTFSAQSFLKSHGCPGCKIVDSNFDSSIASYCLKVTLQSSFCWGYQRLYGPCSSMGQKTKLARNSFLLLFHGNEQIIANISGQWSGHGTVISQRYNELAVYLFLNVYVHSLYLH